MINARIINRIKCYFLGAYYEQGRFLKKRLCFFSFLMCVINYFFLQWIGIRYIQQGAKVGPNYIIWRRGKFICFVIPLTGWTSENKLKFLFTPFKFYYESKYFASPEHITFSDFKGWKEIKKDIYN